MPRKLRSIRLLKREDPNAIEIIDVEEVPLAYLPGNATRIRVKAAARLIGSTQYGESVRYSH
jgi:hypothetical protein